MTRSGCGFYSAGGSFERNVARNRFLGGFRFFWMLILTLAAAVAVGEEQILPLTPGWNAVYLEVQPEARGVEAVVGDVPIERLVMWLGSERKIQFIANPEEILRRTRNG